jgi:hypothetical protein
LLLLQVFIIFQRLSIVVDVIFIITEKVVRTRTGWSIAVFAVVALRLLSSLKTIFMRNIAQSFQPSL